jgi:hypothetical protein
MVPGVNVGLIPKPRWWRLVDYVSYDALRHKPRYKLRLTPKPRPGEM